MVDQQQQEKINEIVRRSLSFTKEILANSPSKTSQIIQQQLLSTQSPQKQSLTQSQTQMTADRLGFGALCDVQQAKQVAQLLLDTYDRDNDQYIDNMEVVSMLCDGYKSFHKEFNPTRSDISNFFTVMDKNKDNKVDIKDLEDLCVRFLCKTTPPEPLVAAEVVLEKKPVEPVKKQKRVYNERIQQRLEVARRLFKLIDRDNSGSIGDEQVPELLRMTYEQIGIKNFEATKDDIKVWMQMADPDGIGKVTIEQYEDMVIRSLERAGIKLY